MQAEIGPLNYDHCRTNHTIKNSETIASCKKLVDLARSLRFNLGKWVSRINHDIQYRYTVYCIS